MKAWFNLRILLLVAFTLHLCSCSHPAAGTGNEIRFNIPNLMAARGEIKISDFCESVDFVALQPDNSWFFPQYSISVKILNQYILFADNFKQDAAIGIFKRNGQFFMKLDKRGKGPGEYSAIEEFGMDQAETKFWVLEGYKATLHWYDLQGKWLSTVKLPTKVTHISVLPNGDLLAQHRRWDPDAYDSVRLYLTDQNGKFLRPVWIKSKNQPDHSNYLDDNWLFEANNELYYRDNPLMDTVYKMNSRYEPESFVGMDLGKFRMPARLIDDFDKDEERSNYMQIVYFYVFRDYLLFQAFSKKLYNFRYDRKSAQTICSESITDDLLGINGPFEKRTEGSEYLVRTIYVPYFKDHPDQLLVNPDPVNKALQDKLRKTLKEAPENLDMILVFYKVK